MTDVMLEAQSLQKAFGRSPALRNASLAVLPQEVVSITGASGSGKSTLLLCLAGVLRPEAGRVCYQGRVLHDLSDRERSKLRRREFGLVLQFGQLVPELTALQNVALPLLLERHGRAASYAAARVWLDRLGVGELESMLPGEMSGGEGQRVAVARALVTGPRVIFADEPSGALDTVSGEQVLELLLAQTRETGASLVLVTHDNKVAAFADREVVLHDGTTAPGPEHR
jgi:putative ABC transport system ATP-binding protein